MLLRGIPALLLVLASLGDEGAPLPAPETIEKAYHRLESLRKTPLAGPGSLVRRKERLAFLAEAALAIHAKSPAAGEDLLRLAELCMDGGRAAEAGPFAAAYLATAGGKEPLPHAGTAHSVLVRSLAAGGKLPEADAAYEAYRKALPGAEGLGPVGKTVADAWLAAGKPAEALARYRAAAALLPRPLQPGSGGPIQALVESLAFAGEVDEARKVAEQALADARGDSQMEPRFRSVLRRLDMQGKPFPIPALDRWLAGAAPTEEGLKGKVAVWHLFSWWMNPPPTPLQDWSARLEEGAPRGLVLVPVTRTGGFDPAAGKFVHGRKVEEEVADLEKEVRALGWKGILGVTDAGEWFHALLVRGLPMEVVVGRDGKVVFCQAGSETGHRLALLAAERALAPPPEAPK